MLVIKNRDEEKEKNSPHLALTHEAQGGPANGRRAALLLKNVEDMTTDDKLFLETFLKSQDPKDEIEKSSYQSLYRKLDASVSDYVKNKIDRWGWAYVRDFDDKNVIFSSDGGVYAISYSVDSSAEVSLGEEATLVNEILSWTNDEGKIIVTQGDSISSDVSQLVAKSFMEPRADDDKVTAIFKSIYEEGKQMDELKVQNDALTQEVANLKADLEKALNKLQEVEEAKAVEKSNKRLEVIKSFAADGEVEVLHKSLATLDDEAFETVTKSMADAVRAKEEDSELFKTVSDPKAPVTQAQVEKTSGQMLVEAMTALNKNK